MCGIACWELLNGLIPNKKPLFAFDFPAKASFSKNLWEDPEEQPLQGGWLGVQPFS